MARGMDSRSSTRSMDARPENFLAVASAWRGHRAPALPRIHVGVHLDGSRPLGPGWVDQSMYFKSFFGFRAVELGGSPFDNAGL